MQNQAGRHTEGRPVGFSDDTRGIIEPAAMFQHVRFARYGPGPTLDGLVDWIWSVDWRLPGNYVHQQQLINHPAAQLSVGTIDQDDRVLDPAQGRLYGVITETDGRRLTGQGWTVAAKVAPGALGLLIDRPARDLTNDLLDVDKLDGFDPSVVSDMIDADPTGPTTDTEAFPFDATVAQDRAAILRRAIEGILAHRSPDQIAEARHMCDLARVVEHDRSICRVEQLAERFGLGVRTLQRLFDRHVGAEPSFLIRRWRIIEAVEAAKAATDKSAESPDSWRGWSNVAAELGYADQAHLTRDFTKWVGCPPTEYVRRL